nr:transcription factor zeb2 [Quercus suber]
MGVGVKEKENFASFPQLGPLSDLRHSLSSIVRSPELFHRYPRSDIAEMAWAPVLDQASVTEQGSRNMSASSTVSTSEAQLEQVLECARQAGFDSLDDFVSAYYATRFDESSTLFFQQRQSRNRHLPGILAEIRQSSRTWTKWERQGYMHEILQSAEAILLNEFRTFANSTDLLEQIRNFDLSKEDVSTNGEGISKSSEIYDILLETQKRCYTEVSSPT